jgi:hypothetical protein
MMHNCTLRRRAGKRGRINLCIVTSLTVYGVWIGNWIYWILTNPWLQVIIAVSLIHTLCNSLQHVLNLLSLLCLHHSSGNGFQRRTFPFLWVPELSPASATATLADWLTNQPTNQPTNRPSDWLLTSQYGPRRKHFSAVAVPLLRSCLFGFPLLLYPIVAVLFFAEPLLRHGSYIFAHSAAVV